MGSPLEPAAPEKVGPPGCAVSGVVGPPGCAVSDLGSPLEPVVVGASESAVSDVARPPRSAESDIARPVRIRESAARDPGGPLLRAVAALAEVPLARACGLGPALVEDLAALASGRTPRLRVALSGAAPAVRPLTAALRPSLPADAVRLDTRPVDSHLLLHVVGNERTRAPAGPDRPDPGTSVLLTLPGAPRASVVVVADDDWAPLGLDSVAGWNANRVCSWPAPWHAVTVRAVVPRWSLTRPQRAGIDRLLHEEITPALDQRHILIPELLRARLAWALRLTGGAAQDMAAAEPTAADSAEAWLRAQARACGPLAHRLLRMLDGHHLEHPLRTTRARDDGRDDGRDGEVA